MDISMVRMNVTLFDYDAVKAKNKFDDVLDDIVEDKFHRGPDVPYGEFADESGNINYKGVTLVCDEKNNAICLGDMSEKNNVLTIPLSGGGKLCINRDNIGDVSRILSLFSPADIVRITKAIAEDKKNQSADEEVDKIEAEVIDNIIEEATREVENSEKMVEA